MDVLSKTSEEETFEDRYGLRKPLGIYNVSLHRVWSRVRRVADNVADYTRNQRHIQRSGAVDDRIEVISDGIEAAIYAAAEHVDDLESCLLCFFGDRTSFAKATAVREFKKNLSPLRRSVSAFANAIKHQQARIRLYQFDFIHESNKMVLIGFFVEGVKNGVVGPSSIIHGDDKQIISIPCLLWEIIVFVHRAGDLLARAVGKIAGYEVAEDSRERWALDKDSIISVARLPNFNLDWPHPFSTTTVVIHGESCARLFKATDLYGSLGNRWTLSQVHTFGGTSLAYQGDGVTRQFKLANPKQLNLQHWQ